MSPLATCASCGAHLSLDHLRGTDCPYCRCAFPHHARAVEHAALVQRVLAQNVAAAWSPTPPRVHPAFDVVPQVHLAIRRTQQAVTIAVAVSVAIGLLGTLLCAVLLT